MRRCLMGQGRVLYSTSPRTWRNWQTRRIEGPVPSFGSEGSTPFVRIFWHRAIHPSLAAVSRGRAAELGLPGGPYASLQVERLTAARSSASPSRPGGQDGLAPPLPGQRTQCAMTRLSPRHRTGRRPLHGNITNRDNVCGWGFKERSRARQKRTGTVHRGKESRDLVRPELASCRRRLSGSASTGREPLGDATTSRRKFRITDMNPTPPQRPHRLSRQKQPETRARLIGNRRRPPRAYSPIAGKYAYRSGHLLAHLTDR